MWYGKYRSFIHANLQHSIDASRVFTTMLVIKGMDKALIQEPWYCKGHIMGLSISCFTLFFVSGIDRLKRASLLWTWNLWMLREFSCRDLVAVKINYNEGESEKRLVFCSAYLPRDSEDPLPTRDFEELVCYCEEENLYLVIGCNSNAKPYVGGPKSNRTLNLVRELEVVVQCAARCCGSTQYSSSLPHGINLGWLLLLLWLFF